MPARRHKLTIAYDGSDFHGWQAQNPPGAPPLRTVQAVVSEAVARTVAQPVRVVGASRTDAGVHARGQVAHFDAETRVPVERLARAITSRLPDDVEVLEAEVVPDAFDAIADARSKQYRYRIWIDPRRPLGWRRRVFRSLHLLDVSAMADAAARLIGRHDFAGFAAAGHGRQTTVRSILDCRVESVRVLDGGDAHDEVHITVHGDGFLYNMVRILSGTLWEIGRRVASGEAGDWTAQRIDRLLAEPDRAEAGPTLPAEGLCLEWIRYATLSAPEEAADVVGG